MTEIIAANYQDIILNTARIFSSVFEIMLAFLLINNFFKPKDRLKKIDYIPFFLLAAGIILLQESRDIGNVKYVLECVFLVIMLFTMYQGKIKHKLTAAAVFIVLLAAAVVVSSAIYSLLAKNMNVSSDGNSPFSELLRLTLSNIIMIPIAVLISTVLKDRSNGGFAFRMWIGLLIVPAVTLITFSVFQYMIETYELNQQIKAYIYLSCIGIIFINAVVFILFWFNQRQFVIKRENDLLTSQLSLQETSIKNLENAYNRTRTFRHDIKNHLLPLLLLICESVTAGLLLVAQHVGSRHLGFSSCGAWA